MRDFRLNPSLRKSCAKDIPKFCGDVPLEGHEDFFEGKVIECLREQAIQRESRLSSSCQREMVSVLRAAAPVSDADAVLLQACPNTLTACRTQTNAQEHTDTDNRKVGECLREKFEKNTLEDGPECKRHIAVMIESMNADVHLDPVFYEACSVDIAKFCGEVPSGEGKQFICMVEISKEKNFKLEPNCRYIMDQRVKMYNMAVQVNPIQSAQALYESVMESPHRNSLVSSMFIFIGVIFTFGLCFGRVSHRLNSEIKNR